MAEDREYLVVAGITLSLPAWRVTDMTPLHRLQKRGADRLVSHRPGRVGYPRRLDEQTVLLPMDIFGDVDENGDPYADPLVGLDANIEALNDGLILASDDEVAAVWHHADGSTSSADVIVEEFDPTGSEPAPWAVTATLRFVVPAGRFVPDGS